MKRKLQVTNKTETDDTHWEWFSWTQENYANIHLARFPNSSDRMGHKANTSTWCVLETEMRISG